MPCECKPCVGLLIISYSSTMESFPGLGSSTEWVAQWIELPPAGCQALASSADLLVDGPQCP